MFSEEKINKIIVRNDRKRDNLAKKGEIKKFIATYTNSCEIKNSNTGSYWNEIFSTKTSLKFQSPMTKDKINWIVNQINNRNLSILDLGIGDAFVEEKLARRKIKYNYSGIDISKTAIGRARKKYKGVFILSDVYKVRNTFKGKKFDLILAIELLEHISTSKLFSLYKQVRTLLKDEGLFILSIPINENLHLKNNNPSAHVRDYTFNIIKTELKISGFEIDRYKYLFAFDNLYTIKKTLARILKMRWQPNSLIIVAKKVKKENKK